MARSELDMFKYEVKKEKIELELTSLEDKIHKMVPEQPEERTSNYQRNPLLARYNKIQ